MIGRFLSQIISIEAAFLLPAIAVSIGYAEWMVVESFAYTLGIMVILSGLLFVSTRRAGKLFGAREGLVCVGFSWVVLSALGALPFLFSGSIPNYIDALFETVSGFTTTGSSILTDVESLPKGLLYWRSFTHWLGGMGVLVFLLAIGPDQGKGFTMHLMRAESPGPDVGKLVPRMKKTAKILYLIYIAITAICFVFLLFGDMNWFEALCTTFGTAGTGGFGIRNDSMASFSAYSQNVCTVFMLLFGINFSCYYLLLLKQVKTVLWDEELRLYLGMVVFATLLIAWNIYGIYGNPADTLRHSAFQVSTIITTTGYTTANYDLWPAFSKSILLLLMMVGACAGSTGGGFKCARVLLVFKSLRRSVRQILNPQKVQIIRTNGKPVSEAVVSNTNSYMAAYFIIVVLSVLLVSLDGFDAETNLSAVLACFNNIGPGLAQVGPICNFSGYSPASKMILTLDMLAGRLEIFPILVLFSRRTWSRH